MQNEMSPEKLGHELRSGSSQFLKRRRNIIGLAFFSSAVLGGIGLYQTGILKSLPGPRRRGFDEEKVNGSAQAYSRLQIPDALLGLTSYGMTACLAGMGPENRWQTHPLMPIGMGLKLLTDAALAGKLTIDSCRKYHAVSVWSLLTAAATFASVPLAFPEAKATLRSFTGGQYGS
jgi:hypothetical protein